MSTPSSSSEGEGGEEGFVKRITGLKLRDGSVLDTDLVVLAPGHSARVLYEKLIEKGVSLEPKPIAVHNPSCHIIPFHLMHCDATTFLFNGMPFPYHLLPFLSLSFPSLLYSTLLFCCLMLLMYCSFIIICRHIPRHFTIFTASCKYSSRSLGLRILDLIDLIGAHHTSFTYFQLVP